MYIKDKPLQNAHSNKNSSISHREKFPWGEIHWKETKDFHQFLFATGLPCKTDCLIKLAIYNVCMNERFGVVAQNGQYYECRTRDGDKCYGKRKEGWPMLTLV